MAKLQKSDTRPEVFNPTRCTRIRRHRLPRHFSSPRLSQSRRPRHQRHILRLRTVWMETWLYLYNSQYRSNVNGCEVRKVWTLVYRNLSYICIYLTREMSRVEYSTVYKETVAGRHRWSTSVEQYSAAAPTASPVFPNFLPSAAFASCQIVMSGTCEAVEICCALTRAAGFTLVIAPSCVSAFPAVPRKRPIRAACITARAWARSTITATLLFVMLTTRSAVRWEVCTEWRCAARCPHGVTCPLSCTDAAAAAGPHNHWNMIATCNVQFTAINKAASAAWHMAVRAATAAADCHYSNTRNSGRDSKDAVRFEQLGFVHEFIYISATKGQELQYRIE